MCPLPSFEKGQFRPADAHVGAPAYPGDRERSYRNQGVQGFGNNAEVPMSHGALTQRPAQPQPRESEGRGS
jgi:hypothetical protein